MLKVHRMREIAMKRFLWATWKPGQTRRPAPKVKWRRFVESWLMALFSVRVSSGSSLNGQNSRGFSNRSWFKVQTFLNLLVCVRDCADSGGSDTEREGKRTSLAYIHHYHRALSDEFAVINIILLRSVRHGTADRTGSPLGCKVNQ